MYVEGFGFRDITPENAESMEKTTEHDMETGFM